MQNPPTIHISPSEPQQAQTPTKTLAHPTLPRPQLQIERSPWRQSQSMSRRATGGSPRFRWRRRRRWGRGGGRAGRSCRRPGAGWSPAGPSPCLLCWSERNEIDSRAGANPSARGHTRAGNRSFSLSWADLYRRGEAAARLGCGVLSRRRY